MGATDLPPQLQRSPSRRWPRVVVMILVVVAVMAGGSTLVLARFGRPLAGEPLLLVASEQSLAEHDAGNLVRRADRARSRLARYRPRGTYIVVDTYRNRLHVYKGETLLRTAICSTGTGVVLKDPRNGRTWVFDTPLGERTIENKRRNPVWAKPDWAFIEEGFLPPKDPAERFDPYSLGDYGLYMGDGYIIHGTLFKSLLGRRVTHGCIRLGDDDLEFVYKNARIGTRVYLY